VEVRPPLRHGADISVNGFQLCHPQPDVIRLRVCLQMKRKLLFFTWWSNLRCASTTRTFPNTGDVTISVSARCRKGSHTYRGAIFGYAAPPPGADKARSAKYLDADC